MSVEVSAPPNALANAIERARRHLLALQDPEGWWKGELESNVTIEAEDLFLRRYLGILDPGTTERTARWIRSRQRADGTWANFRGGPPELSTTTEAYAALRLAGDRPEDAHMRRAAGWVRAHGGIEATRVFTRIWLALNGWWSWDDLPAMPPEVMLLPRWSPLTIYDLACWARQTCVALTVVRSRQPVRPAPFPIDELRTYRTPPTDYSLRTWAGRFAQLDRLLRWYEQRPVGWLREMALSRAEAWIVRRQERDGSWGGIQPPWVNSILALTLQGYPLDHPVIARAWKGWTRSPSTTGMCVDWKPVSRRSGTPRWPWWRWPTPGCPPTTRRWFAPPTGCWIGKSACGETGPYGGRTLAPAAGRSSLRT